METYEINASYFDLFFKAERFLGEIFTSNQAKLAKSRQMRLASREIPGKIKIFRAPTLFSGACYAVFPYSESKEQSPLLERVRTFLGELQKESTERDKSGFFDKIFQNP